jgi:uncharacterized phiE125 gp8 family phage protein
MSHQILTAPTLEPLSLAEAKAHLRVTANDQDALITLMITAVRQYAHTRTQRQLVAARYRMVLDCFPGEIELPVAPALQVASIKYLDASGVQQTLSTSIYATELVSEPGRIAPVFGQIWPLTLSQIGAVEVQWDAGHAAPFTANAAADTISLQGWKTLAVLDTVRVSNRDQSATGDGALPGGLAANTDYYVQTVVSPGVYKLSATSGGAAIDITTAGTGDNFVGSIPAGMKSWMLVTLGALYENRETFVIDQRITSAVIPEGFIDSLLDPFRVVTY